MPLKPCLCHEPGRHGIAHHCQLSKAMQKWKPLSNFERIPNTVMICLLSNFICHPFKWRGWHGKHTYCYQQGLWHIPTEYLHWLHVFLYFQNCINGSLLVENPEAKRAAHETSNKKQTWTKQPSTKFCLGWDKQVAGRNWLFLLMIEFRGDTDCVVSPSLGITIMTVTGK